MGRVTAEKEHNGNPAPASANRIITPQDRTFKTYMDAQAHPKGWLDAKYAHLDTSGFVDVAETWYQSSIDEVDWQEFYQASSADQMALVNTTDGQRGLSRQPGATGSAGGTVYSRNGCLFPSGPCQIGFIMRYRPSGVIVCGNHLSNFPTIYTTSDGRLVFRTDFTLGVLHQSGPNTFTAESTYGVIVVWTGSVVNFYVNGVLTNPSVTAESAQINPNLAMRLGTSQDGTNEKFNAGEQDLEHLSWVSTIDSNYRTAFKSLANGRHTGLVA